MVEVGTRGSSCALDVIESCMGCKASREGFFCHLAPAVLRAIDEVSHHTVMPAGALLFVEDQVARGVFVICSGSVKLTVSSREGRVLMLKYVHPGEVIGLSATISAASYATSAETATSCQLNFIARQDFIRLLQNHSELGLRTALWLSQESQGAYRDIHNLLLSRSSSTKLARLLLSYVPRGSQPSSEVYLPSAMTHEEIAQRIGSSRETVTRSLCELRKKRLIRLDGDTLVIRDRPGLEALAV